jgi:YD repeat-containing protein
VPTLTSVTLPNNARFDIDYNTNPSAPTPACEMGTVHSIKLPPGGKYVYDYQVWTASFSNACPRGDPNTPGNDFSWAEKTTGIAAKHELDAGLSEVGKWQYIPSTDASPGTYFQCTTEQGDPIDSEPTPAAELAVTVITPSKHKNIHYFSVWPGDNNLEMNNLANNDFGAFTVSEYGLPITRNIAHLSTDGLPLSTESYECDSAGNNCVLKRQTFATYGADAYLGWPSSITDRNRHITLERTVFHDDGDKYVQTTYAGEDGFGHQRTVTTTGTFGGDVARSTYTNYNPGSDPNGLNGGALYFPSSGSWILNTFADSSVTQGAATAQSTSCFDGTTGFLLGRKSINSAFAAPQTHRADVVALYQNDGMGNVAREDWFGGDNQDASAMSSLCSPASGSAYRISHTYSNGVLAGTGYQDPATGSAIVSVVDQTIDPTGLVWKSRDPAGVETVFNYDVSGRVSSATTPGTANVAYEYTILVIPVSRCRPPSLASFQASPATI